MCKIHKEGFFHFQNGGEGGEDLQIKDIFLFSFLNLITRKEERKKGRSKEGHTDRSEIAKKEKKGITKVVKKRNKGKVEKREKEEKEIKYK